ncbi:MAG: NAD kinase [Actinomycetia bacterium]|nr:NAD kinase [Actinomycetes bacterium]
MTDETRQILLVTHTGRPSATETARRLVTRLQTEGIDVVAPADEAAELAVSRVGAWSGAETVELVVVVGGDGTILRGAELARAGRTPLLGINVGRVGFLAEAEQHDLDRVAEQIVAKDYTVEPRVAVEVEIEIDGQIRHRNWALNEIAVEKASRSRMIEVGVEVDGRRLSRWGCDGVVCATPTGSTAYAFSAGGPVVWPEVDALLVVPLSAHALFARPLVIAPSSVIRIDLLPRSAPAVLSADGRRGLDLPPGAGVSVRRSDQPVLLARVETTPFTARLVAKFGLPVQGWTVDRDRSRREAAPEAGSPQ